jgi:RHS repeat-associated protein
MWRWDPDTDGSMPANSNPAGLGTFTYNLGFPGQYYLPETGQYIESDPIGLFGGSYSTYAYADSNPISLYDATGLCPTDALRTLICLYRSWHNQKVNEKVAELREAGYLVATNVAVSVVGQPGYAVADYIATVPDSNVYQIGEVKTGNATLSTRQSQHYQTGIISIVGNNAIALGLPPGERILAIWPSPDRYPGCPF